jgi:hypothetical protein
MIVGKKNFGTISAALDWEHCRVAKLSTIGDAKKATAGKYRTLVPGILSRTG